MREWHLASILKLVLFLGILAMGVTGRQDGSYANEAPPQDLTFEGLASGGGTVSITLSADMSSVVRAAASNVSFSSPICPATLTQVVYYYPPRPIADEALSFSIPNYNMLPTHGGASFQGTVDSASRLSGTATHIAIIPGFRCETPPISWEADGPIDKPPGPADMPFAGSVADTSGSIRLWTDPDRTEITAVAFDSLVLPPCTDGEGPLTLRGFFESPKPISPVDGSFKLGMPFGTTIGGISVDGSLTGPEAMEGTLDFRLDILGDMNCLDFVWSAALDPVDSDLDGCIDSLEHGSDRRHGGQRDAKNFWDFFDVPTGTPPTRDRMVLVNDIAAVAARFGSFGDVSRDPLSDPPPAPTYHTAFDRSPAGSKIWEAGPPDGAIFITDVVTVMNQFGHSCL